MAKVVYKTVFENEHFIIVDKPSLVLSVPSRLGTKDPRPCLGLIIEADLKSPIFPCHRLDFEVSGLIIYAKNPIAHQAANKWFESKTIEKTYVALTSKDNGPLEIINNPFSWECLLLKGKKRSYISPHGKNAITRGHLVGKEVDGSYRWHLNPITGRSHQLRFELFRHGHPIIGDELYGSKEKFMKGGIALRAFSINFEKIDERLKFGLAEKFLIAEF